MNKLIILTEIITERTFFWQEPKRTFRQIAIPVKTIMEIRPNGTYGDFETSIVETKEENIPVLGDLQGIVMQVNSFSN